MTRSLLNFTKIWKSLNPRARMSTGDADYPIPIWTTFSKIWLPAQKKTNQLIKGFYFDIPEDSDSIEIEDFRELEAFLLASLKSAGLALPKAVFMYETTGKDQLLDIFEVFSPFFRNKVSFAIERQITPSPEEMEKQLLSVRRRTVTVDLIRTRGIPKLENPFELFLGSMKVFLKSPETTEMMFHQFITHFFRRLDWHLLSQVKIKWDRAARILHLKKIYESEDKEKMARFLTVARRSLPYPANTLSSQRLMDILIRNPIMKRDKEGLTLSKLIYSFSTSDQPLDLGEEKTLFPPKFLLIKLNSNLEAFAQLKGFEHQAMVRMAKATEILARHIPFMAQCLEVIEKKSQNPIQIGFLGLEKRWKTNRKFLTTQIPEAVEGTNLMLFLRDHLRNIT